MPAVQNGLHPINHRPEIQARLRLWGPGLFYSAMFCVLTFPSLRRLTAGSVFCDAGDGLQNLWNLWWVRKALLELHQLPWHTTFLHFPFGTTLVGHTLNPLNGLLALP